MSLYFLLLAPLSFRGAVSPAAQRRRAGIVVATSGPPAEAANRLPFSQTPKSQQPVREVQDLRRAEL